MAKAIIVGHNALGDTLCTTPGVSAFKRAHPGTSITYVTHSAGYTRILDGNPDIDLLIYSDAMLFNGVKHVDANWLHTLPIEIEEETRVYHLDLKLVCTTHAVFEQHISRAFASLLGVEVRSSRPIVTLNDHERRAARKLVRRPYVMFSMNSVTNPDRADGQGRAKDWPFERWCELATMIRSWGEYDVIAIGSEYDPRPSNAPMRVLYGLQIKTVAALLAEAACVVTVENGIAHLAAAVDAPTVEIYGDLMPIGWAAPDDVSRWTLLRGAPQAVTTEQMASAVRKLMQDQTPSGLTTELAAASGGSHEPVLLQ